MVKIRDQVRLGIVKLKIKVKNQVLRYFLTVFISRISKIAWMAMKPY